MRDLQDYSDQELLALIEETTQVTFGEDSPLRLFIAERLGAQMQFTVGLIGTLPVLLAELARRYKKHVKSPLR